MWAIILAALCWAQEPAPSEPDDYGYEITVYGKEALRQARWDVVIALKRLGWKPKYRKDGRTVFRPPRRWLGRAELDASGHLSFTYPIVRFREGRPSDEVMPRASNPHLSKTLGGYNVPYSEQTLPAGQAKIWLFPSRVILDGWYVRVLDSVRPQLEQLNRVQRDTVVREHLNELPKRLDALWDRGEPLNGGAIVPKPDREQAVLFYWGTLPDNFEGHQLSRATERWIRNMIPELDPVLVEQANQLRADGRKLL